jgi:hypothetical protein
MRERLPLVLSATAVFIAVLGSTSLGQAAGNAVGQTVQKAKVTAGFGPSASRVLRGPRGPRGRRGPRGFRGLPGDDGADGAPGTAVAYGYVTAAGTLDSGRSKSLASATRVTEGRYCVVLAAGVTAVNAVATIGQSGVAIAADVAFGPANCASGIEVRTYSGDGTYTSNDFYININ